MVDPLPRQVHQQGCLSEHRRNVVRGVPITPVLREVHDLLPSGNGQAARRGAQSADIYVLVFGEDALYVVGPVELIDVTDPPIDLPLIAGIEGVEDESDEVRSGIVTANLHPGPEKRCIKHRGRA
jgi:hypothetical protein